MKRRPCVLQDVGGKNFAAEVAASCTVCVHKIFKHMNVEDMRSRKATRPAPAQRPSSFILASGLRSLSKQTYTLHFKRSITTLMSLVRQYCTKAF